MCCGPSSLAALAAPLVVVALGRGAVGNAKQGRRPGDLPRSGLAGRAEAARGQELPGGELIVLRMIERGAVGGPGQRCVAAAHYP
ncbi:hypothetical protein [Micromonospora cremea]|uniref:hypothetical protein n=1 Tax=Micromonospora cremea TaxID=709881 RepID=UPI0013564143|nr:hypothetical protein [Micromonospora cremea]